MNVRHYSSFNVPGAIEPVLFVTYVISPTIFDVILTVHRR